MAFERLELQVVNRKALPAGITITKTGKTFVSLNASLVKEASLTTAMRFIASIGKDEDAGKLRLTSAAAGTAVARELKRTKAFFINLGPVPQIGTRPSKRRQINARFIAHGIVEIDLPERQVQEERTAPPQPPPAAPKTKPVYSSQAETYHGVTIDFTRDEERVSFKGKETEVTARQAQLVKLLARPRPAPVDQEFLRRQLWNSTAPAQATSQLSTMVADLKSALAGIGLELRFVKGAGYQLRDAQ